MLGTLGESCLLFEIVCPHPLFPLPAFPAPRSQGPACPPLRFEPLLAPSSQFAKVIFASLAMAGKVVATLVLLCGCYAARTDMRAAAGAEVEDGWKGGAPQRDAASTYFLNRPNICLVAQMKP